MFLAKRNYDLRIWGLALGYFIFYAPYSALVKVTTTGLLPLTGGAVTGIALLPAAAVGTAFVMVATMSLFGWWKHAGRRQVFGVNCVCPSRLVILSGFGTAIIIGTTMLAYSFAGISIVFALLLMRGGVLIIAPIVDFLFKRKVRWFSWVALGLSLAALFVALADIKNYQMTVAAGLNIAAYLSGYLLRLPCLNKLGKSEDKNVAYCYLVEEQTVAAIFLVTIPALFAVIGQGSMMMELRHGFIAFFSSSLTPPGFAIGALYAGLYFFGTLIYLDGRENTFCIPLNRCSSLLAGIFATYALAFLLQQKPPSVAQLGSSGLIVVALLFLSPLHHGRRVASKLQDSLGEAFQELDFVADLTKQTSAPAPVMQTAFPDDTAHKSLPATNSPNPRHP